ncbi:MAG: carbohydrate-binding protein, partial [Deltaproteobacteria bacterium]|nr:carbohydrate-binding protein [Deltaproteobacteria bacterium]
MTKQMQWAMSLTTILAALAQHGCGICTCPEVAPQPGMAAAVAAPACGESTLAGSVAYDWKNVVILGGGFVSGIVFSPVEKDLVYARTDVGGAYRYNPADKTWIPLNDDIGGKAEALGIESLAADPVDPNKVYMATGMYTQSWAGYGAMLLSSDRGNTWKRIDMPIKMGGNENGRSNGERLAVDPNQASILYFGSRKNGLWKSTDAGENWDEVKSFAAKDGGNGVGIPVVLFDKASGSKGKPTPVLYAAVANNEGSLYRSTDGGATWKLVPKQPKGVMASHAEFDSNGVLYVSYGNGPGPNEVTDGSVWKYQPKQEKWTDITPAAPKGDDK